MPSCSFRNLSPCLLLLALVPAGCAQEAEEEPCATAECPAPAPIPSYDPCAGDFTCGWTGFGIEPLLVPTSPHTSEIALQQGIQYERTFAFQGQAGRVYTFSCTAEGFEACALQMAAWGDYGVTAYFEQVGRITHAHYLATYDRPVHVSVKALPAGSAGTFQYALGERSDDHAGTPESATPIVPGGLALQGRLDVGPDTDAFAFEAQQGRIYAMLCEGPFSTQTAAGVTDPDGAVLTVRVLPGSGPGLLGLAERSGRHVFRISADSRAGAVPYTCRVEDRGEDDHGDSTATATRLPEGERLTLTGSLELPYDHDYFAFEARAGHAYALRCEPATQDPCRDTYVVDAAGNVKVAPLGALQDKLLFVRVRAFSDWTGDYALTLEDLGADEGRGAEDALPVSTALPGTGYLLAGDEDFFRFEPEAQRVYRVRAEGFAVEATPLADPSLSLTRYDQGWPARLFKVATGEPVLLRVSGNPGAYTLLIEALNLDDHADAPAAATALGTTLSSGGQLDSSTDVDWFSVQLEQRPYTLQRSGRDTRLMLLEADGVTPVPWDQAAGAYVPRAAGAHLVRAERFGYFQAQDPYLFELRAL